MHDSPYIFERGAGLVHIRLRAAPDRCVADVRVDAFEIAWAEAYREGYRAAIEDAQRVVAKGTEVLGG